MKKTALVAGLVLATSLTAAPLALAQETPPRQPVAIEVGKACGTVTLTFTNPMATEHGFRWNAVDGDGGSAGARTGLVVVGPSATVKETIRFEEDEFGGTAAVTVAVAYGPDSDIQPRLDIYPVDTDCAPPVEPTEEPEPEPTPDPEPPVDEQPPTDNPPADDDPADPKPAPKPAAPGFSQVGAVPSGGVQTGGGPA